MQVLFVFIPQKPGQQHDKKPYKGPRSGLEKLPPTLDGAITTPRGMYKTRLICKLCV